MVAADIARLLLACALAREARAGMLHFSVHASATIDARTFALGANPGFIDLEPIGRTCSRALLSSKCRQGAEARNGAPIFVRRDLFRSICRQWLLRGLERLRCDHRCHFRYLAPFAPDPVSGAPDYVPDKPDNINTIRTMCAPSCADFHEVLASRTMSETQFTRADWRPSRKRASHPRVRAYGGQKKAPAAFLAAGKLYGLAKARKCAHCGRVALRETSVCRFHGGGKVASLKRPYVKRPRRLDGPGPASASTPGERLD